MRSEITDIHCHVLPGVDDGPKTLAESVKVLAEASRQGVKRMIVTPHYHPGRYLVEGDTVLRTLEHVQIACECSHLPIRLYPGQECYWYSGLIEALDKGKALTMNHTSFVLVEFEPEASYSVLQNAVRSLGQNGYQPIMAHFERYACLHGRQERLDELREFGAFLQLNYDRLLDKDTIFHRNPWRRLLQEGTVDFLGSDTHGMRFRPPHIREAVEWMTTHVEEGLAWKLMERNPGMLWNDRGEDG